MAKKGQSGFTLVELLVCIVVGSIVTMAAVTVLLMGLRINKQSTGTVSRQNTTRVLMTALEDVATEGNIAIEIKYNAWEINNGGEGADKTVYFSYLSDTDAIYTGKAPNQSENKKPFLDGVLASDLELDNGLLTVSVTTEDGTYQSSVYCRTAVKIYGSSGSDLEADKLDPEKDEQNELNNGQSKAETAGRTAFLKVLASQYKVKDALGNIVSDNKYGRILNTKTGMYEGGPYEYYTQWYIKGGWGQNGWSKETPWCACFVTWAIHQTITEYPGVMQYSNDPSSALPDIPSYAGVDSFIMFFIKNGAANNPNWKQSAFYDAENEQEAPEPGDIIFFDWEQNGLVNILRDPDHVGVVLYHDDEYVYTIEGNTSNKVAVRQYRLNDPRILGYGVLAWNPNYGSDNS